MTQTELICPVCQQLLRLHESVWSCPAGHGFDRAREGYVNLLAGHAPAKLAGDSPAMLRARTAFLKRGYYQPLAAALLEEVFAANPGVIADVGCGEGYYLRQIMAKGPSGLRGYGCDIAKAGVAAAAKSIPAANWVVADTNILIPLATASVDVLMCIFAPRNPNEFARVLRPGGRLVIAIPEPKHLESLRSAFGLMGIQDEKIAKISAQMRDFSAPTVRRITTELNLGVDAMSELIEMTPNARHLNETDFEKIRATNGMKTAAHFEVLTFIRH